VAVAYYGRDAVERCQFGWRALCIAAGDDDSGRWIEAMARRIKARAWRSLRRSRCRSLRRPHRPLKPAARSAPTRAAGANCLAVGARGAAAEFSIWKPKPIGQVYLDSQFGCELGDIRGLPLISRATSRSRSFDCGRLCDLRPGKWGTEFSRKGYLLLSSCRGSFLWLRLPLSLMKPASTFSANRCKFLTCMPFPRQRL